MQHLLFEQLEATGSRLSFVGDPDQSIYQFNDAEPRFCETVFRLLRINFDCQRTSAAAWSWCVL